ncbi:MAG: enoyl-CoA hydratase-related protein [Thermoplasmatota archaeon]
MGTVQLVVDQGVATLTVERPEALNALNAATLDAIGSAAADAASRARVLVVTGSGKAFVAGADIPEMSSLTPAEAAAFSARGQGAFQAVADFPGPTIAAVNGYALGGGLELALACDVILASDRAVLGQPEVSLGVIPGFGGTQRLARRVGAGKAKWLLFTGERVKADEALRLGLVDWVVPHDALSGAVRDLATKCMANAPLAVAAVKRLVDLPVSLEEGLTLETKAFGDSFATHDQREGMGAFVAKRKPAFEGR